MQGQVDDAMPVVVLDEQGLRVLGQHGTQGTRARGAHRGPGRVLRAVGDDQGPRPALQRRSHVVGQRPLLVDTDRNRPQPERRDQIEHTAPARILVGDGVTGPEVHGQHALDGVERARGDHDRPVRHSVRVQVRTCEARQLRLHGGLSVEHRLPVRVGRGRREGVGERGQQGRIRIAVGQIPYPGRHVQAEISRAVVTGLDRTRLPRRPAVSITPRSRRVR